MDDKKLEFLGSSHSDLIGMPKEVVRQFGYELGLVQNDLIPEGAKHLTKTFENGVWDLRESYNTDAYRAVYFLKHEETVFILHCFKKKSTKGGEIPDRDRETIAARLKTAKDRIEQMKKDKANE